METRKVECDKCGADLTTTPNCEGWRIVLAPEPIPSQGGAVTMVARFPPLARSYHFCWMACLQKWLAEDWPKILPPGHLRINPDPPRTTPVSLQETKP